jgi:hypothetical protein
MEVDASDPETCFYFPVDRSQTGGAAFRPQSICFADVLLLITGTDEEVTVSGG